MGHRHTRRTAARTAILAAVAALALAGGCAAKGAPSADQETGAGTVATDNVTSSTTVPTPDSTTEPTTDPASEAQMQPSSDSEGSGGDSGGGSGGDSGGDSGAGSGGGSDNRAAGSPIDVPTVPEQHTSMEGLRSFIESSFIAACGGTTLCVTLVYQDGACFVGYKPSGHAPRGSRVTVLTESQQDCDAGNSGAGPDNSAAGSPIDVPTVPDQHTPMDGLRSFIESSFIQACGGTTLCVTLVYQDGACFVGYNPSGQAARGSKVTVLTESQKDCDIANGTGTDGSTSPPVGNAPTPSST